MSNYRAFTRRAFRGIDGRADEDQIALNVPLGYEWRAHLVRWDIGPTRARRLSPQDLAPLLDYSVPQVRAMALVALAWARDPGPPARGQPEPGIVPTSPTPRAP